MSSRRLEDVFSVTIFGYQDVLEDVKLLRWRKTSLRPTNVWLDNSNIYFTKGYSRLLEQILRDEKKLFEERNQFYLFTNKKN